MCIEFVLKRAPHREQILTASAGDKEQHDDDLCKDLLRYSETRPAFIKGLLENVSTEINPI